MAQKKAKTAKKIESVTVDKGKFDAAIDTLLKAPPLPKSKVKGDRNCVPRPIIQVKPDGR